MCVCVCVGVCVCVYSCYWEIHHVLSYPLVGNPHGLLGNPPIRPRTWSLLLQSGWQNAAGGWLLGVALAFVLCATETLPLPFSLVVPLEP